MTKSHSMTDDAVHRFPFGEGRDCLQKTQSLVFAQKPEHSNIELPPDLMRDPVSVEIVWASRKANHATMHILNGQKRALGSRRRRGVFPVTVRFRKLIPIHVVEFSAYASRTKKLNLLASYTFFPRGEFLAANYRCTTLGRRKAIGCS